MNASIMTFLIFPPLCYKNFQCCAKVKWDWCVDQLSSLTDWHCSGVFGVFLHLVSISGNDKIHPTPFPWIYPHPHNIPNQVSLYLRSLLIVYTVLETINKLNKINIQLFTMLGATKRILNEIKLKINIKPQNNFFLNIRFEQIDS